MIDSHRRLRWLREHGWPDILLPLLIYSFVALLITWPLATHLSSHVAGPEYADSVEYARLGWWAKYALQHGLNPFYQGLFGFPDGFFSATQWSQPLIYWPIALLDYLFDPITSFNIWLLLEIILSGLTAYWLCREILRDSSRSTIPALFGGLIFMVFPAVQGHVIAGHVNPLAIYCQPVLALCLYRIVEGRGGLRAALAGAFTFFVLALGNFTFPVFTLLPLLLFGGLYYLLFRRDRLFHRATLRSLAIMFGVGVLLILPFYLPLLADITSANRPAYLQEGGWVAYSTDPLAFFAVSPYTPWGQAIAPEYSTAVLGKNASEGTAYLGIVALALATIATWKARKLALPWLVIGIGCMIFSLGPLLKWQDSPVIYTLGENQSNIVLPWALFQNLPLISVTRTPGRFNLMTGMALGVLTAIGMEIALHPRRAWLRPVLAVGLTSFVLLEYQLIAPFPITDASVLPYFHELGTRTISGAVFDVPWDDPVAQKEALLEQMTHQKPLLAGYVSRRTPVDPAKLTLLSNATLNRAFTQDTSTPLNSDQARSLLKDNGVAVVVYHWSTLDRKSIEDWAIKQFFLPAYRDSWHAIFEIPSPDHQVAVPVFTLSDTGWWRRNPSDVPWLEGDGSIYIYAPESQDRHWTLTVSPLIEARRIQLSVDGVLVRSWQISGPAQQIDFWLSLQPGYHTLQFTLPDGCTPIPVIPECVRYDSTMPRDPQHCALNPQDGKVCVGVALDHAQVEDSGPMVLQSRAVRLYGDSAELFLRAFRAPQMVTAGQNLTVETDWRTQQRLRGDYHLFIHVLDGNGQAVAQYDGIPGAGSFPTTAWAAPQTWDEQADVPIPASVAPGQYSIYVGWYHYPDLKRLKVDNSTPHASDGLVYLQDVTVQTQPAP